MAKIFKFIYPIILFFFLLLISNKASAAVIPCKIDEDCPQTKIVNLNLNTYFYRCIKNLCTFVKDT
uniref:Nodule-specific cysteine-rich peptide L04 n=1 Tax=Lens culinaris TaxID=3864 RepID=A0A7T8DV81_LENCU|nr:nodule-specific cysteine-rich peptide L04 [Lens culinaris]